MRYLPLIFLLVACEPVTETVAPAAIQPASFNPVVRDMQAFEVTCPSNGKVDKRTLFGREAVREFINQSGNKHHCSVIGERYEDPDPVEIYDADN